MKREELEELVSAYIDNELPEQKMLKVESLVRSDAQAKKIHDDFISIRNVFQTDLKRPKPPLPPRFAKGVIQAINIRESQNISTGKFEPVPLAGVKLFDMKRLANPRIYAFPIAAVLVVICLSLMNEQDNPQTPSAGASKVAQNTVAPVEKDPVVVAPPSLDTETQAIPSLMNDPNYTTFSPLAGPMPIQGDVKITHHTDGLTVVCQIDKSDARSSLFPKLFADQKVDWKKITAGNTNSIVYEVNIDADQFKDILKKMSIFNIKLVNYSTEQILDKFHESDSDSVRFQVEISGE